MAGKAVSAAVGVGPAASSAVSRCARPSAGPGCLRFRGDAGARPRARPPGEGQAHARPGGPRRKKKIFRENPLTADGRRCRSISLRVRRPAAPEPENRILWTEHLSDGPATRGARQTIPRNFLLQLFKPGSGGPAAAPLRTESLILAQDERWRRA